MADMHSLAEEHKDLSEAKQKKAGQAIAGDMDAEHENFLKTLISLLDKKEIDVSNPQSFLNTAVYDALPQEWKDKTDLALLNIVEQVRLIENFYRSEETPDSSPQLQTMIEHLWQMKQRIEDEHDVFKI